jgi:hypothetical protein
MSEERDSTDWRRLREFTDVDLTRSFILSWHIESGTLFIDIDLFLRPEHPFYEKPRPAEKICIRPACIEFPYCDGLILDGTEDAEPVDIADNLRIGAITGLRRLVDARYEISGDFGTVFVNAERPLLKLKQR